MSLLKSMLIPVVAACCAVGAADALPIRFLGTGAADHDWAHIGAPGVRGSASTLLNGKILIDAGATGRENLSRFGIDPATLTDLVITHTHSDHFDVGVIGALLAERGTDAAPLGIWCSPEGIALLREKLPEDSFVAHPLKAGDVFEIDGLRFTTLPSNHLIDARPEEQTFHYLIETPQGNILYALDGAWMTTRARKLIGERKLRLIVWDATMEKAGDWRSFEHNDLEMIGMMIRALRNSGAVDESTVHVLDHLARTLWPPEDEAEAIIEAKGYLMARDGMQLELSGK